MIQVFKIGGSVIEDSALLTFFCRSFASLEGPRVIVHGGGVMASELQKKLGQTPVKIEGRRVTDAETLTAVTMSYAGWCNKTLVATLQKEGCNAIGLAGCDGNVIRASKRAPRTLKDGRTVVDYGFVGDVVKESVNAPLLQSLLAMGMVPVLCAINHDGAGQLLNTNADTVACAVASSLGARLVCCFELDGVLEDRNDPSSVIARIGSSDFERMVSQGSITEGMIPKIENCLNAIRNGASGAIIKNAASIDAPGGTEITL